MRLLAVPLVALLGCASVSSREGGLCPESASLSCLSTPECSFDRGRGCKVCQCTKPLYNPVPPDQRLNH
jgi:hypothetical protein